MKDKVKVLLVTQYFYPENFKSNDIAFELAHRGYDVTVLTGLPNYPEGQFYKGYSFFKRRRETVNGVKIIRSWLFPRGKGGGLFLALNYFSWAFFASIDAFFIALFHKYDMILGHEPSPITQGIPAIVIRKMQKIPFYFWVLDLWPESLISAGGVSNKVVLNFFTSITKFVYNHADKILISSRSFRESILEKGDYSDKLVYFPNWAENVFEEENNYQIPKLPSGFIVLFAGNIGEAQDFDNIMQASLILKENKEIHFVFVGDGRKRPWVEQFIQENELQETVHLMGRYPIEAMPVFFNCADALLVALKDELIFNLTVPAKIQAYMAAGKPILAMLNGEGAAILEEAKCGYAVDAGQFELLAQAIVDMKNLSKSQRLELGENGRFYNKQNFSKQKCIDHLCQLINQ